MRVALVRFRSKLLTSALPLALAMVVGSAQAAVVISSQPTQNMSCSSGVCAPTAKAAVLNVGDLETMLASGSVTVTTTGAGVEAKDIDIKAAASWSTGSALSLQAHQSINIGQPVSVQSLAALTLTSGSKGTLSFGKKGNVTFANVTSSLTINGTSYMLENSIKSLAGAIAHNSSGTFALARSYDAGKDGTYKHSPVVITFEGTFEGLGNTISNLGISDSENDNALGLFAYIDTPASVLNLRLTKANVVGAELPTGILAGSGNGYLYGDTTDGTVTAKWGAGGLIGLAGAANGTSTIVHCSSAANVQSPQAAGGLVGELYAGAITNSYASGMVDASDSSYYGAGGLVGFWNSGAITGSFATGAVSAGGGDRKKYRARAGGLIGFMGANDSLANSYATGSVTGGRYSYVGGLVGFNYAGQSYGASVTDSYSTGALSGNIVGGLVGGDWRYDDCNCYYYTYFDTDTSGTTYGVGNVTNEPGITGLTSAQLQSGLPQGFDPKIWGQDPKINNGLPYLLANPPQ